jgi:2-octaprenyl-6-methoxyphenol hydroxylase
MTSPARTLAAASPATADPHTQASVAIVGAGPVGLALALLLAERAEHLSITVYDARPLEREVGHDARTLALSLGSVQLLEQLQVWPDEQAQSITRVHVSQQPTSPLDTSVTITAQELGCDRLGAVLPYGALVAPLQQQWLQRCATQPQRLMSCFGQAVQAVRPRVVGRLDGGAGVDIQLADGTDHVHDVAVIAEGGVFADQVDKASTRANLHHDYRQTAWVGTVQLALGAPIGLAIERFTRHGPAALLPLPARGRAGAPAGTPQRAAAAPDAPDAPAPPRAALVWCVNADDDPVRDLDDAQRVAVLNTIVSHAGVRIQALEQPLKSFALGLHAQRTLVDAGAPIVRIGNAAQTLHPVAGQGLNLGLRDAYALASALAQPLNPATGPSLDATLRRVAWQRAPDRWALIASTDFLARSFTWTLPGIDAARGVALAVLDRATPLKRLLARHMMFGSR